MDPSDTEAGVLEIIRKAATPKDGQPLTSSTRIADLGIASIDVYEIFFAIEDRFGIEIDETAFTIGPDTTIADLLRYVEDQRRDKLAS